MDEGITFPSLEAAKDWMAQQSVEARILAATLPIDYRRLVYAVVVGTNDSDDEELAFERRIFLNVFGEDPDELLTRMIDESGRTILPGSENPGNTVEVDGDEISYTVGPNFGMSISWIRPMGDHLYRVETSYYCGTLCAGQNDYIVRATPDEVEIVRVEPGWIS